MHNHVFCIGLWHTLVHEVLALLGQKHTLFKKSHKTQGPAAVRHLMWTEMHHSHILRPKSRKSPTLVVCLSRSLRARSPLPWRFCGTLWDTSRDRVQAIPLPCGTMAYSLKLG